MPQLDPLGLNQSLGETITTLVAGILPCKAKSLWTGPVFRNDP
jgi:hypothetical protein